MNDQIEQTLKLTLDKLTADGWPIDFEIGQKLETIIHGFSPTLLSNPPAAVILARTTFVFEEANRHRSELYGSRTDAALAESIAPTPAPSRKASRKPSKVVLRTRLNDLTEPSDVDLKQLRFICMEAMEILEKMQWRLNIKRDAKLVNIVRDMDPVLHRNQNNAARLAASTFIEKTKKPA